jgi:HlyD family secretion protein
MFRTHRRACAFFSTAFLILSSFGCQSSSKSVSEAGSPPERSGVAALGRLEPKDRVVDISVAGDERLDRTLVKHGDFVKAGDVLAYLQSFETRKAARDRAVALLQDAESRLRADTEQSKARIDEASLRVRQLKEVPALEIQAQRARIRETQADLNLAIRDLDRARTLLEENVIPRQEFDRRSALVDRLRAAVESEEATLQKLTRTETTDREIGQAQLSTRARELESVQASAQLASLRASVQLAEAELKESVIRAPSDGQIIEIIANPGEAVLGRVILRMGDVSQMYVLAEVYETDMGRVRQGQSVEVSSPALSKTLTGKIERLGTSVFKRQVRSIDPQADADARVVQVRARLDDSEEAARFVGLQVDVRINTEN